MGIVEQPWPAYVDDHRTTLAAPPEVAWPQLRAYVDERLARAARSPLTRLLGTRPRSGFAVTHADEPHRLPEIDGAEELARGIADALPDRRGLGQGL